jgi:hypothetical protein
MTFKAFYTWGISFRYWGWEWKRPFEYWYRYTIGPVWWIRFRR